MQWNSNRFETMAMDFCIAFISFLANTRCGSGLLIHQTHAGIGIVASDKSTFSVLRPMEWRTGAVRDRVQRITRLWKILITVHFQMMECGRLASVRRYRPNEVVYAGDRDNSACVYFVLSGDCSIFQCLQVISWLVLDIRYIEFLFS